MKNDPRLIFKSNWDSSIQPPFQEKEWVYQEKVEWVARVAEILNIQSSSWELNLDRMTNFNHVPFPNARQIFVILYDDQHRLIRVNHPITWAQLWQYVDHICTQYNPKEKQIGITVLSHDGYGTIKVLTN